MTSKSVCALAVILEVLLGSNGRAWGRVELALQVPSGIVAPDATFEAPLVVNTGGDGVASYAVRVTCDPGVLKIVEIRGGTAAGFTAPPVFRRGALGSGTVDLTANSGTFEEQPTILHVATIRFQVVGSIGKKSPIRIRRTPGGDITQNRSFRRFAGVRFVVDHPIVRVSK